MAAGLGAPGQGEVERDGEADDRPELAVEEEGAAPAGEALGSVFRLEPGVV